jgi:hypothetical protein
MIKGWYTPVLTMHSCDLQVTGVFVYDLDGYPKLMELFERVKTMVGAEASSTQTTGSNGSQAVQEDDFFDKKLDPSKQGPDVVAQRFKLVHASAAQLAPASLGTYITHCDNPSR